MTERAAWDRREDETSKAYEAFRSFREQGPRRSLSGAPAIHRKWSARHDWAARATAWDDHLAMSEDEERVEAVRSMHRQHRDAGRAALELATNGLRHLSAEDLSAAEIVRLLELGARLERDTLTRSVDELLGRTSSSDDDPWDRIARELADADPPT